MASTPEEVTARFNELATFTAELEKRIDNHQERLQFQRAMIDELEESIERKIDTLGRVIEGIERALSERKRQTR